MAQHDLTTTSPDGTPKAVTPLSANPELPVPAKRAGGVFGGIKDIGKKLGNFANQATGGVFEEEPTFPEPSPGPLALPEAEKITTSSTITPPPLATPPPSLTLPEAKTTATSAIITPQPKKEPPKTEPPISDLDKVLDTAATEGFEDSFLKLLEQRQNGEDPLLDMAMNYQIEKMAGMFEAQSADLALRLGQQELSGTNAGFAWLNNMAQSQGMQFSDIVGKLNYDSIVRIEDWNRNGYKLANEIWKNRMNRRLDKYDFGIQQIDDLKEQNVTDPQSYMDAAAANGVTLTQEAANFIANNVGSKNDKVLAEISRLTLGSYKKIEEDFEAQVPGLITDGGGYSSLTPSERLAFSNKIRAIQGAMAKSPPDVEGAKALLLNLQEAFPTLVLGDYSEWNPFDVRTIKRQKDINGMREEARLQYEAGNVSEALKLYINNVLDPETIEAKFTDLWAKSESDRDEILELAGLEDEPIGDEEKSLYIAADYMLRSQESSVERDFESVVNNLKDTNLINGVKMKQWLLVDGNADALRTWLANIRLGGGTINSDGIITQPAEAVLPPWNQQSKIAYRFMDWPMADAYDEDSDELNIQYSGNNAYEPGKEKPFRAYQEQMDVAWENYKADPSNELDRLAWFAAKKPVWDAASGKIISNGKVDDSPERTPGGLILNPTVDQQEENTGLFKNLVGSGKRIQNVDVITGLSPTSFSNIPNSADTVRRFLDKQDTSLGDWINFGGVGLRAIKDGGNSSEKSTDFATFELADGGGIISLVAEGKNKGKWYVGDPGYIYLGNALTYYPESPITDSQFDKLSIDIASLTPEEIPLIKKWRAEEVSKYWIPSFIKGNLAINRDSRININNMQSFEEWLANGQKSSVQDVRTFSGTPIGGSLTV